MSSNDTTALSLSASQGQTVCCASVTILLSRSPVSHYSWQTAETEVAPLQACTVHQPLNGTHFPHLSSSLWLPHIPLATTTFRLPRLQVFSLLKKMFSSHTVRKLYFFETLHLRLIQNCNGVGPQLRKGRK